MLNVKKALMITGFAAALSTQAQADVLTFDTWTSSSVDGGNYILTIDDNTAGRFNYNLTVDPWNAESLGLFLDLGHFDFSDNPFTNPGALDLDDIDPAGEVALYAYDTASPDCGANCALATLEAAVQTELDAYDSEWELTFRLGDSGFDSIQTFSFSTLDFGLELDDFRTVAVRANQFCQDPDLLPGDISTCYYGNKSYATNSNPPPVNEPGIIALLSIALGMVGFARSRKKS